MICSLCSESKFPHMCACMHVCSAVYDSLQPHGLQPARLLCPWNFPGKNTGVGCYFLHQGIFPTQGLKTHFLRLLHSRRILYQLSHQGSLSSYEVVVKSNLIYCINCLIMYLAYESIYNRFSENGDNAPIFLIKGHWLLPETVHSLFRQL